jgi:hexosaminidase
VLEAKAPGQNLDRRIASKTADVVHYQLSGNESSGAVITDMSGNGYYATFENDTSHTPLGSKGHNYTLLGSVHCAQTSGVTLSGPDTSFGFASFGDRPTLAFTSSNIIYPLLNYTLQPQCLSRSRTIVLIGTENPMERRMDGEFTGDFLIGVDGTS